MEIKRAALIGLGSIGSFFAPKIYNCLKDSFTVIASGERKTRIQTAGVNIGGVNYKFKTTSPDEKTPKADLVIISVKYKDLNQALEDIKNQVGENTQILCTLNGIDSDEITKKMYGEQRVLYSYMRVSIVMKNGVTDYDGTHGKIHFGEKNNAVLSQRVKDINSFFDRCGIIYQNDEDMIKGMWFKFMCNIGENLTCALLGAPFGVFQVSQNANAIRIAAMEEVIKIANKLGVNIGKKEMDSQERVLKGIPFNNKPSTSLDIELKRKTEVEMFAGKMMELGEKLGIDTPVNRMFYYAIKALEEKNEGLF